MTINPRDDLNFKNFCVEYIEVNKVSVCARYEYYSDLRIGVEAQRRYTYPFVRFWMRQSAFGEEQLQKAIDPTDCTDLDSLTFNPAIPKNKHWYHMCTKITEGNMNILQDGYKDNFWMNNCAGDFDPNSDLVPAGQECGNAPDYYCQQHHVCRPRHEYLDVRPYQCYHENDVSAAWKGTAAETRARSFD